MKQHYCVISFHSTYHALQFENIFKNMEIPVQLMPIPRQISSSCGTAAEFPCERKDEILKICEEYYIEIDQVHQIEKENSNPFLKWLNRK